MPSSGKHSKKDAEEVYHVGMELALSAFGVSDLRLPEVITKARVVAATDSSSAEEDGGSAYDLTKKKKRRGTPEAKWVLPCANHATVSDHLHLSNTMSRSANPKHFYHLCLT